MGSLPSYRKKVTAQFKLLLRMKYNLGSTLLAAYVGNYWEMYPSFVYCCYFLLRPDHLAPVVRKLDNAIQRISFNKTNHAIRWIVIYPVDSVIHLLNNPGLILRDLIFSYMCLRCVLLLC